MLIFGLSFLTQVSFAEDIGFTEDPLKISIGGRAMGMGGVYVGVADGTNNVFNNSAGMATQGLNISSMSTSLLGDVNYLLGAINFPVKLKRLEGAVGFGIASSSISQIITPTQSGFNYFDYRNNVWALSYGSKLSLFPFPFYTGLRLKYFDQGFSGSQNYAGSGFDLDLSFLVLLTKIKTNFGLIFQDFLPSSFGGNVYWPNGDTQGIPMIVRMGLASNYFWNNFLLGFDYEMNVQRNYPAKMHFGGEWSAFPFLRIRGGLDQTNNAGEVIGNPTLGIGINVSKFIFDYAYHPYFQSGDDTTHYFSFSYSQDEVDNTHKKYIEILSPKNYLTTDEGVVFLEVRHFGSNVAKLVVQSEEVKVPPYKIYSVNVVLKTGKNEIFITAYDKEENILEQKSVNILRKISLKDIDPAYFAKESIETLATLGALSCYFDQQFDPFDPITRLDLAKIFALLSEDNTSSIESLSYSQDFNNNDPETLKYVNEATKQGWLTFYKDNSFEPESIVTRGDGVAAIVKFAKLSLSPSPDYIFQDVPTSSWLASYVYAAKKEGFLDCFPRGDFHPKEPFTKGEALFMLSKVSFIKDRIKDFTWFNP
ncbi:hypothetical protein A2230_02700 [candidate division WOR-1 bacterium RIFOXYA2_FULL_36_21]|uniref:SLH domain-containing protein n=1 Tax=candidate division WOR-1 bacterium RIFOXYB2_FULL_36_35 TaxID=1802578 RepID=A0A1F4RXG1_UNCSA|nr:MAG: hypothetical protein A2230_02700 [candidate division WOR-1 bacterium RIFOXYA2_FULL_36_21]OGC12865.1 MAG: hypothetical protein A2290_02750 [candidate division WOR-1 bacterium RIFOXYB2_FULL_36_35]OGC19937.1 MAG: hypothetical protein A2282_02700 [candidate division WOR-1 bacterium RIFOXYA12_FULL_36_13]